MIYDADKEIWPDIKVVYKNVCGIQLPMHIYLPVGFSNDKKYNAAICIHGGGWYAIKNNQEWTGDYMVHQAQYYAQMGMVGIAFSYRSIDLTKNTNITDLIDDCKNALLYVVNELSFVNRHKLVLLGDSAGGYLATCLGLYANYNVRPYIVVAYNPILDCTREKWSYCCPNYERRKQVSPLYNVVSADCKFLLFHGTDDDIAEICDTELFNKKMNAINNECEFNSSRLWMQNTHLYCLIIVQNIKILYGLWNKQMIF